MKTTVLILCLFFIGTTVAQTPSTCSAWSAVFTVTNPAISNNGYNDVTVSFDWSKDVIQFAYPSATEVYQYNTGNGITNYDGQAKFTFGSLCGNCNRNSLLQSQAPLGFGLTNPTSSLAAGAVTGDCRVYTPSTRSDTMLSSISFSTLTGQNGRLCSFTLKDGRVFTYKSGWSCSTPTIQSTDLDGCKCSSRIDVWLLFDHSGSISMTEMAQLKTFGTHLIGNLTLQPTGPGTGAQVGMSWFNDRTGLNFGLTDVRSVIDTGLNNWNPLCGGCANTSATPTSSNGWACLPNNDKQNCANNNPTPATCQSICANPQQNIVNVCSQCGGGYTNIALGLVGGRITTTSIPAYFSTRDYKGVLDFFYGPGALNRNVPKVIITLTDGVANRIPTGGDCNGDCQITNSIAALRTKHNDVFPASNRPPLTFLAVGVGNDLNDAQLKAAAEGNQANVLKISNFAEALNKVRNLMDLVCPEGQDINACPNCCGACVCGTCIPPTACKDSNYCQPRATLGGSTVCCEPLPRTCTATPCKDVTCSSTTGTTSGLPGSCVYTDRICAQTGLDFPSCQKKVCNPANNTCSIVDSSTCTCPDSGACVYGDWGLYDPLTCPSCGSAPARSRKRVAISGGEFCPGGCGPQWENSTCPFICCPKDCAWSAWSEPNVSCACKTNGICSSLETGNTCVQSRTRSKIIDACPGADCVGPSTNVTTTICDCGTTVHCQGHNVTSPCDCETGKYKIYYVVDVEASEDTEPPGDACPFTDGQEIDTLPCPSSVYEQQPSQTDRCPTDCDEEYSEWSSCNCFFGTRTRNYTVTHQATNDGASCADPDQQQGITVVQTQPCTPTEEEINGICPTGTVCLVDADCDDSNACTTEHCKPDPRFDPPRSFCQAGEPVTCTDYTACESAECVPASGCVYTTTVFCNDLNACTNDTCNPDSGACEFVDITCDDRDDCALGFCDAERGCGIYQRTCNETEDCFTFSCDPDWEENGGIGPCVNTSTCYNPIGVIAAISTGAAIAIALALGFLALLLVGGTASAVAYSQKNAEENKVTTNPMYQQKGHHGHNPFHNN